MKKLKKFISWMNSIKYSKKALVILIVLDVLMAITSNIADWHWLMSVEWYLMPFAPICSLYPLTLAVWFTIYYRKGKVPAWFTTFIFIGIISYGFMAYIYYPLFMQWNGIEFRLIGNMLWVTAYALQSLIIASELRPLPVLQYVPIVAYFYFKDYSDRYLGSFIDIFNPGFPQHLKELFFAAILILHTGAITLSVVIARKNSKRTKNQI
jgi:hypothetical protein